MQMEKLLNNKAESINKALDRYLPNGRTYPVHLMDAMRYSVFSGGKRVRPFLVLEASKLCGGSEAKAMPVACAVEMIHAYSLIHDDLPVMDDDDVRRGRKTCHRQFDEATAILAGDALLPLAFEVVSEAKGAVESRVQQAIRVLSRSIGPYGMVAGQAADLQFQKKNMDVSTLSQINRLKTGALIAACVEIGALWATRFLALKALTWTWKTSILSPLRLKCLWGRTAPVIPFNGGFLRRRFPHSKGPKTFGTCGLWVFWINWPSKPMRILRRRII